MLPFLIDYPKRFTLFELFYEILTIFLPLTAKLANWESFRSILKDGMKVSMCYLSILNSYLRTNFFKDYLISFN